MGFVPKCVIREYINKYVRRLQHSHIVVDGIGNEILEDVDDDPRRVLVHTRSRGSPGYPRILGRVAEFFEAREAICRREVHWLYFSRECERLGKQPSLSMPVICECFTVAFSSKQ